MSEREWTQTAAPCVRCGLLQPPSWLSPIARLCRSCRAHDAEAGAAAPANDAAHARAIAGTLDAHMQQESDALISALVDEYAAVLAREGPWAEQGTEVGHPCDHAMRCAVAAVTLQRVAERLGVHDLHERALHQEEREP